MIRLIQSTSKPKRADGKLFVWRAFEGFEMVGWLTPLVGDDCIELAGDTVAGVFIKALKISP